MFADWSRVSVERALFIKRSNDDSDKLHHHQCTSNHDGIAKDLPRLDLSHSMPQRSRITDD